VCSSDLAPGPSQRKTHLPAMSEIAHFTPAMAIVKML
jgi:hypothetical protein